MQSRVSPGIFECARKMLMGLALQNAFLGQTQEFGHNFLEMLILGRLRRNSHRCGSLVYLGRRYVPG